MLLQFKSALSEKRSVRQPGACRQISEARQKPAVGANRCRNPRGGRAMRVCRRTRSTSGSPPSKVTYRIPRSRDRQCRFEFLDIKAAERVLLASCLARNRKHRMLLPVTLVTEMSQTSGSRNGEAGIYQSRVRFQPARRIIAKRLGRRRRKPKSNFSDAILFLLPRLAVRSTRRAHGADTGGITNQELRTAG